MASNRSIAFVAAAALYAIVSPGCAEGGEVSDTSGDDGAVTSASGGGLGGSGNAASGGAGAAGAAGGEGGAGGDAGSSSGGAPIAGRSMTQFVSAGKVSTSATYRLVQTLGQPTQNQKTTESSSYRLHGGLVGANASTP